MGKNRQRLPKRDTEPLPTAADALHPQQQAVTDASHLLDSSTQRIGTAASLPLLSLDGASSSPRTDRLPAAAAVRLPRQGALASTTVSCRAPIFWAWDLRKAPRRYRPDCLHAHGVRSHRDEAPTLRDGDRCKSKAPPICTSMRPRTS